MDDQLAIWNSNNSSTSRNAWGQGIDDPEAEGREIARKVLDAARGEIAKEEAISRVEANASRAWLDIAYVCVVGLCRWRSEITTDDVWLDLFGRDVPDPHEPRAMGPVMRKAVTRGHLRPTSTFRPSAMPQNHRRPVRVYEVTR